MKLLGWTIVASGLLMGLAACTVTSDTTPTDGGTGGTAGTGGAAGTGGVAGAAGATGGAAGAAGAATCEPGDPNAACDVCAATKCCTEWLACDADKGNPEAGWTEKCADVWVCAMACDAGTLSECIASCTTDNNPLVNDYYTCVYVTTTGGCATECQ